MADFAQAVKWMQDGKVAIRENYPYLEYAFEEAVMGQSLSRTLVMRHRPDYEWEDLVLLESDITADDWQGKPRRMSRKGKGSV